MSAVDPQRLDVLTLPSIEFFSRKRLPPVPAIYFVMDSLQYVRYIGQTNCLKKRWNGPNKPFNPEFVARISWLVVEQDEERRILERRFIRRFQPSHNHQGILPDKPIIGLSLGIPRDLYIALDLLSDSHGRTITEEAFVLLSEALRAQGT